MAAKPRGVVLQDGRSGFSIYPENREQLSPKQLPIRSFGTVCGIVDVVLLLLS